MWFRHGISLQYRCDFQLVGLYPYFEMSCPCDPNFSCCGWRVGFACDRWWLFSFLCLLCLGHMCFDLPYCFSDLYLSSGGVGVFVKFDVCCVLPWVQGSMVFCIEKPRVLVTTLLSSKLDVCHPYGLVWGGACDLPWFEGELVLWRVYCIFCLSLVFSSYSPKSLCFTCYIGLYLFNYAYHCARMSSNEMWDILLDHAR
jgi:hypothetical protein